MLEITRDELLAFTDAHAKSAVALEKISDNLGLIVKNQEKILDIITNGMTKDIVDGVTKNYNEVHKETIHCLTDISSGIKDLPSQFKTVIDNSDMSKDIDHAKFLFGAVALIVVIAVVILKFMFSPPTIDQIKQAISDRPTVVTK